MQDEACGDGADRVDLNDLRSPIPGTPKPLLRKRENIDEHLAGLHEEFAGKPRACFELAKQIVYLRRHITVESSWSAFLSLWQRYSDIYLEHLTTRWLVSVCDTISDHGTDIERKNALMVSAIINFIKLAETGVLFVADSTLDITKVEQQTRAVALWDGMTAFMIVHGDMTSNLFRRIRASMDETPMVAQIWAVVCRRFQDSPTFLNQLRGLHVDGWGL